MNKGYITLELGEEEQAKFYSYPNEIEKQLPIPVMKQNQYLIIRPTTADKRMGDNDVMAKYRWNGKKLKTVEYHTINNLHTGVIKPRNLEQQMAIDMLLNDKIKIKVLTGVYGSGK